MLQPVQFRCALDVLSFVRVLWVVGVCGSGEPKEANEGDANESAKYGLQKRAA
jgi:hypothetical protein